MLNSSNPDLRLIQGGTEACRAGHSFGPAVRDFYLIHYIEYGKGVFRRGGREWALGAGDGFVIFPDEVAFYQADGKEPWKYHWFGFVGDYAREALRLCRIDDNERCFHFDDIKRFCGTIESIRRNFYNGVQGEMFAVGVLYQALSMLMKCDEESPEEVCVSRASAFFEANYGYPVTVSDAARAAGVDRTTLYRAFMKKRGISPKKYLLDIRLSRASGYLAETALSVTQTAYSCGFQDVPHFSRMFKMMYGVSPTQYRKAGKILRGKC